MLRLPACISFRAGSLSVYILDLFYRKVSSPAAGHGVLHLQSCLGHFKFSLTASPFQPDPQSCSGDDKSTHTRLAAISSSARFLGLCNSYSHLGQFLSVLSDLSERCPQIRSEGGVDLMSLSTEGASFSNRICPYVLSSLT